MIIFPFKTENTIGSFIPGNAVSLNKEGKLQVGAGTTITKNVHSWEKKPMSHLHSTHIGKNMVVSVYDGHVTTTYVTDAGAVLYAKEFDLPAYKEKQRSCDDLIPLRDNIVVSLGSTELLPMRVEFDEKDAKVTFFDGVAITEGITYQPVIDTLGDSCFAISYFYSRVTDAWNTQLATRTGCINVSEKEVKITLTPEVFYSPNYMFHAIAGLSETKYVLAKAVDENMTNSDIIFQLATVKGNTVKVGKELVLKNRTNFGFFDMDNLNDHQIIVTFIDGNLDNGLESILLVYNQKDDELIIGPFLDNQDGGASGQAASGQYNFIYIRIMSETRFGIFYSNVLNQGATAFCMGEVTPAQDLIAVGPEYLISAPMTDPVNQYYWLGETNLSNNRLVLIESLTSKDPKQTHSELHVVDVKPLPLGVVAEVTKNTVSVAISGTIKVSGQTLASGHNYYADTHGHLVKGEFVGSMNTESYYIYVESEDGTIVSDDNRVGFAINANSLFLKVHN